jgi:hypothetical protein
MLITGFAIAAGTAAKWLLAAKIMTTVGTGCITAAPVLREIQKNRKMKRR